LKIWTHLDSKKKKEFQPLHDNVQRFMMLKYILNDDVGEEAI
jgi:hypothetical protein